MERQPSEHDILAYIEGNLDAHALRDVEALIASDPALQQFVKGARADRAILLTWGTPGATIAPQGLVREAIRHAERDALLDSPIVVKQGILARIGTPRHAAAAAILLAAGAGIVVGPSFFQSQPALQPGTADTLATAQQPAESKKEEAVGLQRTAPDENDRFAIASLDDLDSPLTKQAISESLELADAQHIEGRLNAGASRQRASAPTGDAALQESMRELAFENELKDSTASDVLARADEPQQLAQKRADPSVADSLTAIGPERLEAANAPHAMSLSDAWALARQHTLRISVVSPDPASLAAALIARPDVQAVPLKTELAPGIASPTHTALVIRLSSKQQSLAWLLDTLQSFEITALTMRAADAPVRVPRTVEEILWWNAPSARWSAPAPLAVLLTIQQQQPAPEATPKPETSDTDSH